MKEFISYIRHVPAQPRNRRKGLATNSGIIVNTPYLPGNETGLPNIPVTGHSHENKKDLDKISIKDDYINLTDVQEQPDGSAQTVTRHAKSGYADEAMHAESAHDIDSDSPLYDKFLRKDVNDTAKGLMTLEKGAQFGPYIPGKAGAGGRIDENGAAELSSLELREFLEAPEFRYNRISIEVGNRWSAPGGGLIERVVMTGDTTGTIYLKLQEGERGAVEVDDICQGIFHDIHDNNEPQDKDDGIGNFAFKGFFTTYFRVTEIIDSVNHGVFNYEIREPSKSWLRNDHPVASMNFVAYGNFSNRFRQTSHYSTRTYERYLVGVNDWEFTANMIGCQFGDLSNLTIFGIHMEGYSAFLNNIFMSGKIQQFERQGYNCEIEVSNGEYIGDNESTSVRATIRDGYGQNITNRFRIASVVRNGNKTAADQQWSSDLEARYSGNIPNPFTLTAADLGTYEATTFQIVALDKNTNELLMT